MELSNSSNFCLPIVCLVLVLTVALSNPVEARYLPTRSDESELDALKAIITNILNEANEHQRERNQLLARSARFFSTKSNRASQLARQLYSMGESPWSEEEQTNRMLLNTALVQRRSAEILANNLNDGDPLDAPPGSASQERNASLKLQEKGDR